MSESEGGRYPAEWETDVVVADGSTVRIRPLRSDDRELIVDFHARQSPESIYFRFFSPHPRLSERELDHFTIIDYEHRMAFVAVQGDQLVGIARYEGFADEQRARGAADAEVSFFVDDDFHGRGLGTLLLEYLAAAARRQGMTRFSALVLPENYAMLRVFRRAGYDVSTSFEDGAIKVDLGIEPSEEVAEAIRRRDRHAQARSVARLVEPSSVAVIGAGSDPGGLGHRVVRHLRLGGFTGRVQVVNRSGAAVDGIEPVTSVGELELPVDLGIVCVPAASVSDVVDTSIAHGLQGLLIMSAGFADAGAEGAAVQRQLVERARRHGLRIIGPNAFGIANTNPAVSLRALFVPVEVPAGPIGLASQSGPLGAAVLSTFARVGSGVSTFAALGNRADVSINDLLQYWSTDERTDAVALYIENFGNFAKFLRLARYLSATRPLMVAAPGVTQERRQLLNQAGVMMLPEVAELAVQAKLAATQPVPSGRRVVIVSDAASVARLAVAACRGAGLEVVTPDLGPSVDVDVDGDWLSLGDSEQLMADVSSASAGASAQRRHRWERALAAAGASAEVDAVLVALLPSSEQEIAGLLRTVRRVDAAIDKPLVAVGLTGVGNDSASINVFDFPEQAARVLGRWSDYGEWRARSDRHLVELEQDRLPLVRAEISKWLDRDDWGSHVTLGRIAGECLLEAIGADVVPSRRVESADDAGEAAEALGFPVVLKVEGSDDRAAGESSGAALDLLDRAQVIAAFDRMAARGLGLPPAIVQPMAAGGHHLAVELRQDTELGARLLVRPGGQTGAWLRRRGWGSVEELVLIVPSGAEEIRALVDRVAGGPHPELEQLLGRCSGALAVCPELTRIRLDPVLVSPDRAAVVDVTAELHRWEQDPLAEVRHL